jgi:hypothetical protein
MSDVAQGPGWWLASDGKWYPPQNVPPPPPPPPFQAGGPQPFMGQPGVQQPGWAPSGGFPVAPPPKSKKALVISLSAVVVVVLVVVLAAIGSNKSGNSAGSIGGGSASASTSAVCADLNSLWYHGGPTVTYLENIGSGSNTTVATVDASIVDVQAADITGSPPDFHSADLKIAAANAAKLASEVAPGIQVDGILGGPDDLHANLANVAATISNAAKGNYTYVGTGNESDNVEGWFSTNCDNTP